MSDIKVPTLPESVSDATLIGWHVAVGDLVSRGDNLVDLETDKVVLEVPAPKDGVIKAINKQPGDVVCAGQVLAILDTDAKVAMAQEDQPKKEMVKEEKAKASHKEQSMHIQTKPSQGDNEPSVLAKDTNLSPSVRRLVAEKNLTQQQLDANEVPAFKPREQRRVPMSRLRKRIADRLVQVKQSTAMLTTFNEVDMSAVINLRNRYKEQFLKAHDVRLGFMSFFTKAVVEGLKRFPGVNAAIDGNDIIYQNYFDIGIAISTDRGLVVPILLDADQLSMADIEIKIRDFAERARQGKLTLEEMTGGTFSITNGGVFGSMLSTPILNPPQSAILGMHNIVERAVVVNGEIVIRPMMYLALSYDHRIIDGKQSISFLLTLKQLLEDPNRFLINL